MPCEDISQNAKEESTLRIYQKLHGHGMLLTTDHNYEPHIRCTKIKPLSRDPPEAIKIIEHQEKRNYHNRWPYHNTQVYGIQGYPEGAEPWWTVHKNLHPLVIANTGVVYNARWWYWWERSASLLEAHISPKQVGQGNNSYNGKTNVVFLEPVVWWWMREKLFALWIPEQEYWRTSCIDLGVCDAKRQSIA